MKSVIRLMCVLVFAFVLSANAGIIGTDDFNYSDGSIVDQAGGSGWDWDNTTGTHTGTVSDWDEVFNAGNVTVSNGTLVTNNGGVIREYNGPGEGVAENPDTDERLGAFRGSGITYYGFDMTQTAKSWGGLSTYDFDNEKIYFGQKEQDGVAYFGCSWTDGSSGETAFSTIQINLGQAYRVVGTLDFDGDEIRMWVDPDASDYDNGAGDNTADAVLSYTGGNWNTAIRLASGAEAQWDNVVVATDFVSVVPEPATLGLLGFGALSLRLLRKKA